MHINVFKEINLKIALIKQEQCILKKAREFEKEQYSNPYKILTIEIRIF